MNRRRGLVTQLSRKRNFVFIRPTGDDGQVYCHRSDFLDERHVEPGLRVEFELHDRDGQARRVRILD